MPHEASIRNLYTPCQPTVTTQNDPVAYEEWLPDMRLQPYIYCYWQLETSVPLTRPFQYYVVADGCIDLFFDLHHPQDSFVMGFCAQYTAFELSGTFRYIGVRLLPSVFPLLFGIKASEISQRTESLHDVLPNVAEFIQSRFHSHLSNGEIKDLLDAYFSTAVANTSSSQIDSRFSEAMDKVLRTDGLLQVEKDLQTGISSRQLRRLFDHYIGDSAKAFSRVVRFQNLLRIAPSANSLRNDKMFFDAGYYDQAHFIKEFRHLYGTTPTQAFSAF